MLEKKIKLFIYILIFWRKMTPTNMATSRGMIRRKVMVGRGRSSSILIQGQKKKMQNKKTVEGEGSSSQTSSKAEVHRGTGRQWGVVRKGYHSQPAIIVCQGMRMFGCKQRLEKAAPFLIIRLPLTLLPPIFLTPLPPGSSTWVNPLSRHPPREILPNVPAKPHTPQFQALSLNL